MDYRVVENGQVCFIECLMDGGQITSENDALDLVGACGENETHRLLLYAENLTQDFYHLRTGLAGVVLQKFATYAVKTAAVLTPELVNQGRFREMVLEANRSNRLFHVFYNREDAEAWLIA
jgi:PadR family transcriptional regulator, regulatory protein AphA